MELSFCYNWEAEFGPISELMNPLFEAHSEVADALLAFLDPVDSPLLPIDTIFKKEGGDSFSSLSPPSSATMLSLPQTQPDDFYLDSCPKRHRSCSDHYAAPPPPIFQSSPFFQPTIPTHCDFAVPALPPTAVAPFSTTAGSLSVQSAAARERRKRISEKTQELSRLVPGGSKMNTAEMLQAAHKYVRFLQAQVGILGLMDPCLECKSAERGHLQVLLASPTIQERLAAEEKCIVPKEMVTELAADPQLKSRPFIAKSMDQLIQSTISTTDYSK